MQGNRCLRGLDYSLPTTAGTVCGTALSAARKFTVLIPAWRPDPSVSSTISYRVTFSPSECSSWIKQVCSENSVSSYQYDEVRVKHGTKNIRDHKGKITQKKYLINEVNWGFSKSFCCFFSFCLFVISISKPSKEKGRWDRFPLFYQKIRWLCWEWAVGTHSLISFLAGPRLLQGESDKQTAPVQFYFQSCLTSRDHQDFCHW